MAWCARHGGSLLAISIFAGIACALLVRWLAGPVRLARAAAAVDGGVVLILVIFAFGVMDGVQARLLAEPGWVLGGIALALWPLGGRLALAAGLLAGNRNQALFLAVLPAAADPGVLLFFALGQIPIFLSPFLLRPVYRRVLAR
jgi:BASS family bile acid:Na+ symporter